MNYRDGRVLSVEEIGKGVALISALCLATAFLYDFVFCAILDRRLLGLLSLADHIEMAIFAVPFIMVTLTAFIPAVAWWRLLRDKPTHVQLVVPVAFLLVFVVASWDTLTAGPSGWRTSGAVGYATVLVLSAGTYLILFPGFRLRATPVRASLAFGFAWFAVTISAGATNGLWEAGYFVRAKIKAEDAIWLTDLSLLKGRVVRVVDKGVILHHPTEGRIHFIPKDQIRRIDLVREADR